MGHLLVAGSRASAVGRERSRVAELTRRRDAATVDEDRRVFTPPRARSFLWTLYAPRGDRRCDNFSHFYDFGAGFAWYHGNVCDHAKEDARGHRGTVTVSYTMLGWYCRARFEGTISDVGDPAVCRRR